KVAVCPILRAGLGMLDGVLTLISGARVGFIGLYRDEETLQPVEYYVKLPQDVADRDVILLDPMLATGNSTAHAVQLVKDALATVLVLTPAVGRAARYLRLADRPSEGVRARHEIPRLGGLALFLGLFVPSLAFLPLSSELRGVLIGAGVATTVGAVDDFRGLTWWQKLGGQVLAASIPAGFGVWVQRFTFPL